MRRWRQGRRLKRRYTTGRGDEARPTVSCSSSNIRVYIGLRRRQNPAVDGPEWFMAEAAPNGHVPRLRPVGTRWTLHPLENTHKRRTVPLTTHSPIDEYVLWKAVLHVNPFEFVWRDLSGNVSFERRNERRYAITHILYVHSMAYHRVINPFLFGVFKTVTAP